jgi:hypothetical protein
MPPSLGSQNKLCLPPALMLVSCSVYSSVLKMEAICCFETSVDFQRTTWHYITKDSTLQENLRSRKVMGYIINFYNSLLSCF